MENQINQSIHCRNCDTPIREIDQFCSNCGQKNTDGRITVGGLVSEFLSATFNLDSKIFRTLRDLMIPGKLTMEYFKGRHKKYVHPIRLFLVSFVVLLGFGLADGFEDGFNDHRKNKKTILETQKLTSESEFHQWFYDNIYYSNKADSISCIKYRDSLECVLYEQFPEDPIYSDSISIKILWLGTERISTQDLLSFSSGDLIEKYEIEGKLKKYVFSQRIKLKRDVESLPSYVINNSVWVFLFLMPFLGLLLHLFNYKRERYYVEHLIFSLHTHAFAFLSVLLMGMLTTFISFLDNSYFGVFIVIMPYAYFFIALKRVYHYSFWKNILIFIVLNIAYFILIAAFFVTSIFISILII